MVIARPQRDPEPQPELRESEPSGIGDFSAAAELERELRGLPPREGPETRAAPRTTSHQPTSYSRSIGPTRVKQVNRIKVTVAAQRLGMIVDGRIVQRCGACGAECPVRYGQKLNAHGGSSDKRGVGTTDDGLGWRCFACREAGDTLDFVALSLVAERMRDASESQRREVWQWCDRHFGISGDERDPSEGGHEAESPETGAPAEPRYLPPCELEALDAQLLRVDEVECVATYLRSRSIDPTTIADLGTLARALPDSGPALPSWARCGQRSWRETGHQLIVSLYDVSGSVRSVIARYVRLDNAEAKDLSPTGYEQHGLVMACPLGLQMLKHGTHPGWWPLDRPLELVIAEGEPDMLSWSTEFDGALHAPALIGIRAGAWRQAHAARIPSRTEITIATHRDNGGDNFAADVIKTLAGRDDLGTVRRWRAARRTI